MTLQAELQLLRDTRRLISNPDRWCQGSFSKEATTVEPRVVTRFGILKRIEIVEVPTTAYCLAGAMNFCDHAKVGPSWEDFNLAALPLLNLRRRIAGRVATGWQRDPLLASFYGEGPPIHTFNDSHTHAEVIALLDEIEQEILDEIEREEILELAAIINESEPEYELVS